MGMSDAGLQSGKAPQGYKSTDVGLVPDGWSVKPLSALADVKTGPFGSALHESDYATDGTPIITVEHLIEHGILHDNLPLVSDADRKRLSNYILRKGDIVFSRVGSVDRNALVRDAEDGWLFSGRLLRVRFLSDDVHSPYVGYHFHSEPFKQRVRMVAVGQTMASLNTQILRGVLVVVPSESEQRAIAEALSDVDGLISALEKLIAKKRAIKQAAMQQLLTGKTRLPGFTGKWEKKRLGDISTCLPTANNPRGDLSEYGEVEYIHYGDIHAHAQPVMDCRRAALPRINRDRIGSAVELQDGDLVLVDASEDLVGVGKSVEVRGLQGRNVVAGLHTILCRGSTEHWALGFKAYLQFIPAFRAALTRVATGISVYAVSKKQLANVELPLPPVPEQEAIVAVLADIDAEIEALERRREKTRQIKQGMMQQLLTGRIRLVKPEPQAPAAQTDSDGKASKPHSWAFNEAVVISTLAKHFGKEDFPLGRKRYTKLSYLLHRHAEQQAEGYLKKAAGPYNPKTKYGGPERIALESGYIREHKSGPYTGFVAADNIAQAEGYFDKWYGPSAIQWLNQFRFKKNDDLELLATVDMAAEELRAEGQAVDAKAVKAVIRSHPEWKAKLDRAVFSDANIAKAIDESHKLLSHEVDH